MTEPKKPRKTRKDKGKKRGKRTIKNPRLQTGSLDFKHIGTSVTMGPNLTALAGLLASSRPVFPTFSQDQQLINELRKKEEQVKNTELIIKQQNIPPQPAFEPDVEQGQEENATKVRKAMGNRIARLNQEKEDLQTLLETNKTLTEEQINDLQERIAQLQDDIDISGLGGEFYKENFLIQEQKVRDLTRELAQERQQGYAMMDKMVELEQEKQTLRQEQDYLRQETENLTGLTRQQQRELELRNEEIQRAQERIMKQERTLDEEIKRGLQFKDEELRQAAMENEKIKIKMMGLEQSYELNKSQLDELKKEMKEGVITKREYDNKVRELSSTINELDKNLKYMREQEKKSNALLGKQQLEKTKLSEELERLKTENENLDEYEKFNATQVRTAMGNRIDNLRQVMNKQLEQQRDQFEEERQSLKGKILEIENQKDLIYETALQAEQEYNEEARTSNEIVGMMAEELLSEKYRRQQQQINQQKKEKAFQDLTEMGSFAKLLNKQPTILSGEEERLFKKYGKEIGSYVPTENELLQLVKEYEQERKQEKIEKTLSKRNQVALELKNIGNMAKLYQESLLTAQIQEKEEDYSKYEGIDLTESSSYGGWNDPNYHISDNN